MENKHCNDCKHSRATYPDPYCSDVICLITKDKISWQTEACGKYEGKHD